ncbi:hypothetical protein HYPSUDRAFT_38750 [Hypholoma sublateritium FD-334 SS-4]|uniref:Uncharacterized protein n=1 Tax=Hypholoma sublateritium (strain FD-334 SS-4) TaxID=945553 RepID=A0A0D2P1B1_HYPSF|nr:hypothetical protein HYPSUDRAFT_38750 [Hypholoma sublateritium FD-334 SS-4]
MPSKSLAFFLITLCFCASLLVHAQNISTSIPVPPLQWINLSNLLQGSSGPPPLRDASVGYDDISRSLILFGGISESGVAQSQTYILDLDTLTWSTPLPPLNLKRTPPARSLALSGGDFAASNRHGFVIIGGKDLNNEALSDVWEYDFNNQFWSPVGLSPGGPSARWGASGGIDTRVPSISDPIVPGPNNTFFLAGGFDGTSVDPLSDIWSLSLSGTLSSNMPNSTNGSWSAVSLSALPGRVGEAGTVVFQQIIAAGGCDSGATISALNATCANQDSFIINVQSRNAINLIACPAPRVAPVLVPNLNPFSAAFASQVLMVLGTFNTSLWQDSDGLVEGEVAILDINTATWTRIIPSGDPSSSPRVPSPRQGATAVSFSEALVGTSRTSSSDTLIFGGQDGSGNFLSDLWLLRAYTGVLTPSNATFAGGQLQSGINADGSGVQVKFLTNCASVNAVPKPSSTSTSNTPSMTGTKPSQTSPSQTSSVASPDITTFQTSFSHKLLLPLSTALLTPVVLFFRWGKTSPQSGWTSTFRAPLVSAFSMLGLTAYGVGIVGFILAFTTISSTSSTSHIHLATGHGIAGLIFFVCLYVLAPLLYLSLVFFDLRTRSTSASQWTQSDAGLANDEKRDSVPMQPRSNTPSLQNTTPPTTPRPRAMSWDTSVKLKPPSHDDGGVSSESPPSSTPTPHMPTGFEVLNRGKRVRKLSEPWEASSVPGARGHVPSTRRLGEIDWLLRRRSLNAVGELDYAITQAHNTKYFANANSAPETPVELRTMMYYPTMWNAFFHVLVQISILGICVVGLDALWTRARRYLFVLFLLWILAFYTAMIMLAWYGRPVESLLALAIWRLRGHPMSASPIPTTSDPRVPNTLLDENVSGGPSSPRQGPYMHHRPPVRTSVLLDDMSHIHGTPLSLSSDNNDDDDEIDEDTRQRLIEEEMERRDVSIVTVPRRKLYLTNPS